jgi:hypothetical protein
MLYVFRSYLKPGLTILLVSYFEQSKALAALEFMRSPIPLSWTSYHSD